MTQDVADPRPATRLIVLRGNSGSGKTSLATTLRERYGRGMAWVGQDVVRRTILRERDRRGAANVGLIEQTVTDALDHGFHVVLEGILYRKHYEQMLGSLHQRYGARAHFYYFDVSLPETLRRHALRPESVEFSDADMRDWYRPRDLLTCVDERILPEAMTLASAADCILADTELMS